MKIKQIFLALIFSGGVTAHAAFINDPAPDFSLQDMQGKQVGLKDYQGSVVFVNFWASWCPPCKQEFPELNELANEYKDQKFKLLAINLDKKLDRVKKFLAKTGIRPSAMVILLDPDAKVVANYVARSMPSSFIIDQEGTIRFVHFGYNDKDPMKWRQELDSLLLAGRKK